MPKASEYLLAWYAMSGVYELRENHNERLIPVTADESAWFAWLGSVPSFTFHGRCGQLTVRKESRPHGGSYWYAYRRIGKKMTKKYLGRTTELTLARLEKIAAQVTDAEAFLSENVSVPMFPDESMQDRPLFEATRETPAVRANANTFPLARPGIRRDSLFATKLNVPRTRAHLVSRSHLLKRLMRGLDCALTLISAPAGFGKTTLLAQWFAESSTPIVWFSLEPEDDEPIRFFSYVIAALQKLDPQIGNGILPLLEAPQPAPLENVLALLTNSIIASNIGNFVFVLDDYHLITAEPIQRTMTFLLEHLPPQMHLVLATRADPPLPLARLRVQGQLMELRAPDLRFSLEEGSAFLRTVMGLTLSPDHLATLERRTEGWIAGLQLAALSLQERTDISAFLSDFTGNHRFVLDYLSEEILSRQPAPLLSFLLHTSILEHLSGPLCDAVTGRQESQAVLEGLEHANLFVVSLDEERQWYRYHQLFAELLRSRLLQTQPTLIPQLHRRASIWYEQHHLPVEAVRHALAAHDAENAARLIEQCAMEMISKGQARTLLGWLKELPDSLVRIRPWLCVYHATALHLLDQIDEAEARLDDAERSLQTYIPAEQARSVLGYIANVRANIARYFGDLVGYVTLAGQALESLPETERTIRAIVTMQMAHTYLVSGDVTPTTEQQAKAAVASARASGYRLVYLRSLTTLARLRMLQGRLREAAATYKEAEKVTPGEVFQVLTASAVYCFGLADLLREWNHLDEAKGLLLQGIELITGTKSSFADELLLGHLILARLQQAHSEYGSAFATLDTFTQLAHAHRFDLHLSASAAALRARIALTQGNLAEAAHWAQTSGLSLDDADLPYPREQEYLTLARVCIAEGRQGPSGSVIRDALRLLDRLLADAEAKARMGSVLEILIVQSLALSTQGDHQRALTSLERALTLAEPEGYIRLFVDEGLPMLTLLRQVQARGILPDYVTVLLSAFGEQHASYTAPAAPANAVLLEPLTEREREVLSWLSAGASNREIAGRLVVSVNTVKRHVYNICGKLGVQSRTQAIVKSRVLNLV